MTGNGSVQYESRIRSDDASTGLRAAQYVRMSTDNQRYSTQYQADAIAAYALQRGFTVVRTYKDEGRSGLLLHGRDALQNLLADVRSGRAGFETILVYDVSRWVVSRMPTKALTT